MAADDITIERGAEIRRLCTVATAAGPVDMSGWTSLTLRVKRSINEKDADALLIKAVDLADVENVPILASGQFYLKLTGAETSALPFGRWCHDFAGVRPSGTSPVIFPRGTALFHVADTVNAGIV